MKNIWAPWRIEYILGDKNSGCFLCSDFTAPPDKDPANLVVYRGPTCGVVMNRYPYTGGHLMICPYRHLNELSDMTPEENAEMMALASMSVDILRDIMHPEGFNIGMNLGEPAGAGLKDHLHMHVVPRWIGDTNFVSVVGDIRVIPQALEELCETLRARFAE